MAGAALRPGDGARDVGAAALLDAAVGVVRAAPRPAVAEAGVRRLRPGAAGGRPSPRAGRAAPRPVVAVGAAARDAGAASAVAPVPGVVGSEPPTSAAVPGRAALPDPEAKRTAWEAMFTTDDLSNYLFTATAQGFWQPEQADLVREYVPRFYTDAVALAARRGPAMADAAGRWAFPTHAVDPETLRLGEECLRDADLTPSLRRKLVDQLDDLERALRVRGAQSSPSGV